MGTWTTFGDGARYNPSTDSWTMLNAEGAPNSRTVHSAVWTVEAMFIYGGFDYPVSLNSAYLYIPVSAISALEELLARLSTLDLPRKTEGPLTAALEAALRSLERGHERAAANQLQAFQRKVEAHAENQN